MCEFGDPGCRWAASLPEGQYQICREHWIQLGMRMYEGQNGEASRIRQAREDLDRRYEALLLESLLMFVGLLVVLGVTFWLMSVVCPQP